MFDESAVGSSYPADDKSYRHRTRQSLLVDDSEVILLPFFIIAIGTNDVLSNQDAIGGQLESDGDDSDMDAGITIASNHGHSALNDNNGDGEDVDDSEDINEDDDEDKEAWVEEESDSGSFPSNGLPCVFLGCPVKHAY
jgi:hypothetical protein